MFKFEIEIGDWSNDGHGKTASFTLESNKDIDYIRTAFLNSAKWASSEGNEIFDPQRWCRKYGDDTITSEHLAALVEKFPALKAAAIELSSNDPEEVYLDPEFMVDWTVEFIKMLDPSITIELSEPLPQLHAFGYHNGEKIGQIGYGLLD